MDFHQFADTLGYLAVIAACFWGYLNSKAKKLNKKWTDAYHEDEESDLSKTMWELLRNTEKTKTRVGIVFWVILFLAFFIQGNFTDRGWMEEFPY